MTPAPAALLRWAEIDVQALRDNAAYMRAQLDGGTALMAMVKSDGYGHGAALAARAAVDGGATWLGVYTPDEALALRAAGAGEPLLVVGWSPPDAARELVEQHIDVTVFDAAGVDALAAGANSPARCHVKVDTGLGRLGAQPADLPALLDALRRHAGRVEIAGIFTHYADPELDGFTTLQHERFLEAAAAVRVLAPNALLHTSGSAAILARPESRHDLVRMGIALYGYSPFHATPVPSLRPAMSVIARVAQVKTVRAGDTVGYGRTWSATADARIATVALGYGQAVPRALSNRGHMLVNGRRCLIAGIVNMDQVTLDVSDAGFVAPGDEVLFFGERDGVRLGADEVGAVCDTLPHELLCRVSATVPRVAVGGAGDGRPAALP